ncbi:MAG: DUF5011 domain-containing protein [Bacteroidota bacterium]
MKKSPIAALLTLALVFSLGFVGCSQEDTIPPVISLVGDATVTVELGGTYTDQGATATDDEDGSLTSSIVVDNPVNTAAAGSYTVTYSVNDAAGNSATATRTVNVVATRNTYLGTYSTVEDCPAPYGLNSSPTIAANGNTNGITLSLFYFNGGSLDMTVDGQNVTVDAAQTPNPLGSTVTGTGILSDDGRVITMAMTITPLAGTPVTCTVTWTKQ